MSATSAAPLVLDAKKSTNVRKSTTRLPTAARLALAARRLGFRALGAVAPAAAGRRAARLFLTPPRFEPPAREAALLDEAVPFFLGAAGRRIAAWSFGPKGGEARGGNVLLVHGWAGRGAQLGAFVAPLTAAGRRVIAIDLPAHGRSEGAATSLFELARVVRAVGQLVGPLEGIVAHSLGGAATVLALADGLRAERVALLAPPADPRAAMRRFAALAGLPERALPAMDAEVERLVGVSWLGVDVRAKAGAAHVPALVVHDADDADVPFEEGRALAGLLPLGRFRATAGLGHRRILRDEGVVREVARFLLEDRGGGPTSRRIQAASAA